MQESVKARHRPFDWTRHLSAAVLDSLPVAAYVCDAAGHVLAHNAAATSMWSGPAEAAGAAAPAGACRLLDGSGVAIDLHQGPLADTLQRGEPLRDTRAIVVRADGSHVHILASITPLLEDGAVAGYLHCMQDLSQQQSMQADHDATLHSLNQIQKMDSIGQLTGGIAHDFNNMLQSVMSAHALLSKALESGQPSAKCLRYIDIAQQAVSRAASLTQRLLAFSRRQVLQNRSVDVNALIVSCRTLLEKTVDEQIRIDYDLAVDLWPSHTDSNQLENALLNLVINARDAMPQGGLIVIKSENVVLDESYQARYADVTPGQYVKISVCDTGTGIPDDVLAHVFEPFYTTKLIGEGTGLGLSMVHGFVKQSSGHVSIHTQLGEGTTFNLLLPRDSNAAAEPEAPGASVRPVADEAYTILIVEDDEVSRPLLKESLGHLGYLVKDARDAQGAITILERRAAVHLLITDIGLPGGTNGRQLAEYAASRFPGLKLLMMTGNAAVRAEPTGVLAHAEILAKPFSIDVLAQRVHAILQKD